MYNNDKIKSARKANGSLQDAMRRRLSNTYKDELTTIYKPKKRKEM